MKDMKMKVKLMICFVLVAVLALLSGLVGMVEVRSLSRNESTIYLYGLGTNGVTSLQRNIQAQRAAYRGGVMLAVSNLDPGDDFALLDSLDSEFRAEIAWLLESVDDDSMRTTLERVNSTYLGTYVPFRDEIVSSVRSGNATAVTNNMYAILDPLAEILSDLDAVSASALNIMRETELRDTSTANRLAIILLVLALVTVGLAIFFAFYISHIIAAPLERMAREVDRLSTGDCNVNPQIDQKDEIGIVDKALWKIVSCMLEQQEGIVRLAEGDFTVTFPVRSPQDTMNKALNALVDSFNRVMEDIHGSATQVSSAAGQISQASQHLAVGSSQQASTIEHLTGQMTNIQSMAENNSVTAAETLGDVRSAGSMMNACNAEMAQMLQAMQEIDNKSNSISRVIKVIDDIAFQTNILALNAAVEAARAGQHGKGFAVVADEVRNLASKSAEAANETAALIEQSLHSVSEGNTIVSRVSDSIRSVGEISARNESSIARMDEASRQQKDSINAVTGGIQQLTDVVQANTSNAEQTAAAAQEMAAQAATLDNILRRFNIRQTGKAGSIRQEFAGDADETGFALSLSS